MEESSLADLTRLTVEPAEAGLRLDGFLAQRAVFPSGGSARRAIAAGIVRVNGRTAKKGVHLQSGDEVRLDQEGPDAWTIHPTPQLVLEVLYADDLLVAISKPPDLPSHPLRASDGPTVASALVSMFPECRDASPDPREGGLAHRLDVGTSGVLVAARSREGWYRMREALGSPTCEKTYVAEVVGRFPTAEEIREPFISPGPETSSFFIDAPIGRRGRHGGKVMLAGGRQPLPARTYVRCLELRPETALVEAKLARGRAHQVRAHLAHLGIPVAGDEVYGRGPTPSSLHLHAWTVSFVHPVNGQMLRIESPRPDWAQPRT